MGLEVTLDGGQALSDALARAPHIVDQELGAFMAVAIDHLATEVRDRTPSAFGHLRGSIAGTVRHSAGGVLGVVGTPLPYAIPVELGTKPHRPPMQPLEDWARKKFGVPKREARRIAYLVARKIGREGTQGAFMFKKAFEANEGEITRQFDLALARIVNRIQQEAT